MTDIYVDDEPVTVVFRNARLTLYPLPLKQLKKLKKDTANVPEDEDASFARLNSIMEMITVSAQIGDPSVTREQVEELITSQNAGRVMKALLGTSGMTQQSQGGAENSPPAMAPPIGASSTQASSPQQDGDGQMLTN